MESNLAKLIDTLLKLFNAKNSTVLKKMEKFRSQSIPIGMRMKYNTRICKVLNNHIATMWETKYFSRLHILFLHGGAYVREASPLHWRFMSEFIEKLKCKLTFIDYPLAPKSNYKETREMLQKSYDKLLRMYPNDKFILMGDSAGGGLALAFLQKLKNENGRMPDKTVLFSPWLDISMSNPQIKAVERLDLLLSLEDLIEEGESYADGDDISLPFLSPIYGTLDGLGDVAVFYGTYEVLLPDCLLLKEKARISFDSRFVFFEFPGMQHDFILFPIPEAEKAIKEACEFILA